MHIGELAVQNWKCFAGRQRLVLEPRAYGVTARYAGNPSRSNWGGKSALLEAVHFALHGEHTARVEDEWITRGEKSGGVALFVEDGGASFMVERTRDRGKSTLLVVHPRGCAELRGAEAQGYVDSRLGISKEDFRVTCYFEQRQMARMVLARPQERMEILQAWLRLEDLVRAEEIARSAVGAATEALEQHRRGVAQHEQALSDELGEPLRDGDRVSPAYLEKRVADLAHKLSAASGDLEVARVAAASARKRAVGEARAAEYEQIAEEGKRLARELEEMDVSELEGIYKEAGEVERRLALVSSRASQEAAEKRKVRLGQFDGRCPVAQIKCPAVDEINKRGKASKAAHEAAENEALARHEEHQEAERELASAQSRHQATMRLKERVDTMRDRVRVLHKEYKEYKEREVGAGVSVDEAEDAVLGLEARYSELRASHEAAVRSAKRAADAQAAMNSAVGERDRLEDDVALAREQLLVFGRGGAQKRVAERALAEIEEGANALLRECGIDLAVEVRWSRQGEGLARACDTCGQPFPASARVKTCARCGADRGPLVVSKLDLVLSDRSGAAEDLVGASFQLSASAWLRADRKSAWGTALIDEPYGSLDEANRRSFATHLATMLAGRYGFRQSLVVSHSADAQEMMPGRVEIECDGGRSTMRVV